LAMSRVPRLGTRSALRSSAGWPFRIRQIGGGGTVGVAGVLGRMSFEHCDPRFLLPNDSK
jgi:hypothetical protein